MFGVVFAFGFRRYSGEIPVVGACSAAISATCHRGQGGAEEKLMWGAIEEGEEVGHCGFSAGDIGRPVMGREYARGGNRQV